MRYQMQNDFGIARRLENGPARFQILPQFRGVRDIAVVRDRDPAFVAMHRERLRVALHRIAGGRITRVPDRQRAGQCLRARVRENIRHMPHRFLGVDQLAVAGRDPRALLPAMLQCVQR